MNTNSTDRGTYELGDPEVARKLRLLASHLPNYLGTAADEAFARRDVQEFTFMKILTGSKNPRQHVLWPAFDPEVGAIQLHSARDARDDCDACSAAAANSRPGLDDEAPTDPESVEARQIHPFDMPMTEYR